MFVQNAADLDGLLHTRGSYESRGDLTFMQGRSVNPITVGNQAKFGGTAVSVKLCVLGGGHMWRLGGCAAVTCSDERRKAVPNSSRKFHVLRHAEISEIKRQVRVVLT